MNHYCLQQNILTQVSTEQVCSQVSVIVMEGLTVNATQKINNVEKYYHILLNTPCICP
jgi:hypothetical protein